MCWRSTGTMSTPSPERLTPMSVYEKPTLIVAHTIPRQGRSRIRARLSLAWQAAHAQPGEIDARRVARHREPAAPHARVAMINAALHEARLNEKLFDDDVEQEAIRTGFG